MLPSTPMNWVTKRPAVERVRYPTRTGFAEGDVYRPGGSGRAPDIVVCLGVVPFGVDHPQVPRLGEGARALRLRGTALLVTRDARQPVGPGGDREGLALAYCWLIEQPYVDATRSGLLGTCVGGAFALMASGEPLIRDRVGFVAAFAPYSSMWTFAADIVSGTRVGLSGRRETDRCPLPVRGTPPRTRPRAPRASRSPIRSGRPTGSPRD